MSDVRLLYIASASILDPLIISQVIRYLEIIAPDYQQCHLITFERTQLESEVVTQHKASLISQNIQWHPVWMHSTNRYLRFLQGYQNAMRLARRIVRESRINVIHARSFLAGQIGSRLQSKYVRLLYDMRGFWTKEKRDKGTIKNPLVYRTALALENRLFRNACHLVSLTNSGKDDLQSSGITTPTTVIPCCVDLNTFSLRSNFEPGKIREVVAVGTLGEGYSATEMFEFCRMLLNQFPQLSIKVLTHTDIDYVRQQARLAGFPLDRISIKSCPTHEVPSEISGADVAVCFMTPTDARIASCPTKLGEYLAVGLPIAATVPIGDMELILKSHQVGTCVRLDGNASLAKSVAELQNLLGEPDLHLRCRQVAESLFSLDSGAVAYQDVHRKLAGTARA